jgi:hypothetical protein
VVDHAGLARMKVATAQFLGADFLARRRLHQRRASSLSSGASRARKS